jgi:hypothetical protein
VSGEEISEKGKAVVESGLSVRQVHEIETGCSPDMLCAQCRKYLDLLLAQRLS